MRRICQILDTGVKLAGYESRNVNMKYAGAERRAYAQLITQQPEEQHSMISVPSRKIRGQAFKKSELVKHHPEISLGISFFKRGQGCPQPELRTTHFSFSLLPSSCVMAIKGNGITQTSLLFIRWFGTVRKATSLEESVVKLRLLVEA